MQSNSDKKISENILSSPKHSMKKASLNHTLDATLVSRKSVNTINSKYSSSSRLTKSRIFQKLSRAEQDSKL